MQLKISLKNSKLGNIPNISMPPGTSCVKGIPCLTEGCYAMKSYRMYPNVRNAWDSNLNLYKTDPVTFFDELDKWLDLHQPKLFRLFVGGDFPDEAFYFMVEGLALTHPDTQFLAFTKRYDFDYSDKPVNLSIVLSTWPGVDLPTNKDLPYAWLEEDDRRPEVDFYTCPGGCGDCGYKCWDKLDNETHVVFPRH